MLPPSSNANHLINEKSPYLQQHAYNPVDWFPWGDEAIAKARLEDKPILVSIGYSTCHWCHVMERESYENTEIAAEMNANLVNIKIDREERPDIDKIYMTAVSAMTGSGGWPLNIFLTPELKPIFGGTYFPPAARWGHPGWIDVVKQIGSAWKDPAERQKMLQASDHITQALTRYVAMASSPLAGDVSWLKQGFNAFKQSFDSVNGGFGHAPKFPMPVYHQFLLSYGQRHKNAEAVRMSTDTLRRMAQGGIYDHVGGGFARYSTDERWHIPHFEKMLYDNAQLVVNYLSAYQITKDPFFKTVAQETLAYVRRDLGHPDGGFYSAEDADSLPTENSKEKIEGAFYVWEHEEIEKLLGDQAGALFSLHFGVRPLGNALHDPHGEFKEKNILYVAHPIPEVAREAKRNLNDVRADISNSLLALFEVRSRRPRPHRDEKILSGWNGLMLSAYAKAYQVLENPEDLRSAQQAAQFLRTNHYDSQTKVLYRRWRDGERKVFAIADDYAFVVQGLLDLYETDFNLEWLRWAEELMDQMLLRFYDPKAGGFYMTALDQDQHLLMRVKEDADNVEPSASSIAVLNLLRLAQYTGRDDFRAATEKTLQGFGQAMKDTPQSLPQMLVAFDLLMSEPQQVVIVGDAKAADTQALIQAVRATYLPGATLILLDESPSAQYFQEQLTFLKGMRKQDGRATAYVCVGHTCKQPTTDPKILADLLAQ